jgi:hypothetical protein
MANEGHRVASPEELNAYAMRAKAVVNMAMDAQNGVCYLICKRSRLDLETIVVLDFSQIAALGITYIQIMQAVRDSMDRAIKSSLDNPTIVDRRLHQ